MNVFPATVILPDGQRHPNCKLMFDGTTTTIWEWPSGESQPIALVAVEGPPKTDRRAGTHTLDAPDGLVTAQEAGSCGCSHRLKHWTPPGSFARRVFPDTPATA